MIGAPPGKEKAPPRPTAIRTEGIHGATCPLTADFRARTGLEVSSPLINHCSKNPTKKRKDRWISTINCLHRP